MLRRLRIRSRRQKYVPARIVLLYARQEQMGTLQEMECPDTIRRIPAVIPSADCVYPMA